MSPGHHARWARILAAVGVAVALGVPVAAGSPAAAQIVTLDEGKCLKPEDVSNKDANPYRGSDPNRQLLSYSPFRMTSFPCNYPPEYRTVILQPDGILLVEGGRLVRNIPVPPTAVPERGPDGRLVVVPRPPPPFTLRGVSAAIADPAWIAEVEPGVFRLDAALVQLGSTMEVKAPDVRAVQLTTRPHVFIGGLRAKVVFEDVTVTSWDPAGGGPDLTPADGRAFVLYQDASRLDIIRSEFVHLGSDRSGAYGTSWRAEGTTGNAIESTFAHSFFGVYTFEARDIVFRKNVFRDNQYYGLDPHDYTTGLVIEDNEAYANGAHGMIFSRFVTNSVMRNNRVHDNGENGIVMHLGSSHNVIEGNLVERNGHDGIVVLGSSDNTVAGNTIRGNAVGIRTNQVGAKRITIRENVLEDNQVGIRAYAGASDLTLVDNLVRGSREEGVVLESPRSRIDGIEIVGGRVGIELRTVGDIRRARIVDVDQGILAKNDAIVDIRDVDVLARSVALRRQAGAMTTVRNARLLAPVPTAGPARDDSGWTGVLPYFGIGALATSVALEILRRARNRHQPPVLAPPGVVKNTA
jgi:parallel beta-helix repeat protein